MRAMLKSELAAEVGTSKSTFGRWLRGIEDGIPNYDRRQKLLTPAQVKYIREMLVIIPP